MSGFNKAASIWVSQIRKILGADKHNHLFLITQKPMRIDISFRDLAHYWVLCSFKELEQGKILTRTTSGIKKLPIAVATNKYFKTMEALQAHELRPRLKNYVMKKRFLANRYYRFYDTSELIDFEDIGGLIAE